MSQPEATTRSLVAGWRAMRQKHDWLAWDLPTSLLVGAAAGFLSGWKGQVREHATPVLFAEAALSIALLAIVLTALSIFVVFLGEEYQAILRETPRGLSGAFRPYVLVAWISAIATLLCLLGALAWPVSAWWLKALVLGSGTWLSAWALLGTTQLLGITAFHGEMRSMVLHHMRETRALIEKRRSDMSA